MSKNNLDWKSQLQNIKTDIVANLSEKEKQQMKREEQEKKNRRREYLKRQKMLYEFLANYKQNSGIFINNFFRNRNYETYCKDKFHDFDFLIGNIIPNDFENAVSSWSAVQYLGELEKMHIAYHPIDKYFIELLIAVSEVFDLLEPLDEDTILYRGCSTIERNGVDGLVSTTTDKVIAEQFSRGTILKIHAPKGSKNINIKSIRPYKQQRKSTENEILLPPCSYQIISEIEKEKGREPNNWTGRTKYLEIKVTPLDLLEEFLKRMENPPEEYMPLMIAQKEDYHEAVQLLKNYIERRKTDKSLRRVLNRSK